MYRFRFRFRFSFKTSFNNFSFNVSQIEIGSREGGGLELTFQDFVLEQSEGCSFDFVQVRLGFCRNWEWQWWRSISCRHPGYWQKLRRIIREALRLRAARSNNQHWKHDNCLPQVTSIKCWCWQKYWDQNWLSIPSQRLKRPLPWFSRHLEPSLRLVCSISMQKKE